MAHRQWTEAEARGVLSALAKSGLSVEAFARERGLVPQRISWWSAAVVRSRAPFTGNFAPLRGERTGRGRRR